MLKTFKEVRTNIHSNGQKILRRIYREKKSITLLSFRKKIMLNFFSLELFLNKKKENNKHFSEKN